LSPCPRSGRTEFFLSPADYAQLVREYAVQNGGYVLDQPDAAARERGAGALLTF
jgi:hypothetical protein